MASFSAHSASRWQGDLTSYCSGITSANNTKIHRLISPFSDGKTYLSEDNFVIDKNGYAVFYTLVVGAPDTPSITFTANNYNLLTWKTPGVMYCGNLRAGRIHQWMIPKGKYTSGNNYVKIKYNGYTYNYNFKLNY
ncbi:hypothetical protein [Seleniivibrio woodruffii]|uniref:hypothetical protein n=2 Tax=Seleniivibrio TaxID=1649493 RepID=UPI0026F063DD|nr:hypothetical protein [Seleniivibrio woodruffii]